jgi:hypothetical protein
MAEYRICPKIQRTFSMLNCKQENILESVGEDSTLRAYEEITVVSTQCFNLFTLQRTPTAFKYK